MTKKKAALLSGIYLLIMAILAMYAEIGVRRTLIVTGDAIRSVENIRVNMALFEYGLAAFILVGVLDILVARSLYQFYGDTQRTMMLLSSLLRFGYAVVLFIALGHWYGAVQEVTNLAEPAVVMAQMDAFSSIWKAGLSLFGLHLVSLGVVMIKTMTTPKWLGWLILIGGAAYTIDAVMKFIIPGWTMEFAVFVGWGEIVLMGWLIWKGSGRGETLPQ